MSLRVAEIRITTPGRSLHIREVELEATTSILADKLRRSLAGDAQLELPSSATNVPTCGECFRHGYHLVGCSRGAL